MVEPRPWGGLGKAQGRARRAKAAVPLTMAARRGSLDPRHAFPTGPLDPV